MNDTYRELHRGMGVAVAERTVLRRMAQDDGRVLTPDEIAAGVPYRWETWGEVAQRVAAGNASLVLFTDEEAARATAELPHHTPVEILAGLADNAAVGEFQREYEPLRWHLANGTVLMSGRHLQHGDATQASRTIECFTNCATSATSFLLFYLLLNGSGVGRCYDDDMIVVDWDDAPNLRVVLDESHADFIWGRHESVRDAEHKYGRGRGVMWFEVPDSREGWAKALEVYENAAFQKRHGNKMLILDFSKVRPKGSPIGGMQNRPASGPVPLMDAFMKASSLKGAGLDPWKQALYIDHYFAECVLVGGARRAARMAVKTWRDRNVLDFIRIKRPVEFGTLDYEGVLQYRQSLVAAGQMPPNSFLWSANDSVGVDDEFWRLVLEVRRGDAEFMSEDAQHARRVFREVTGCSYADGTGEPGLLNQHKLVDKSDGWVDLDRGDFVGHSRYQPEPETAILMAKLARRAKRKKHRMIVNPCSEINLLLLGGYCVIGDGVPYHAQTLEEAADGLRVIVRALIRTNRMEALYHREVARTNRIGVGLTGVHEFAWKFFRVGFRDLVAHNIETDRPVLGADGWPVVTAESSVKERAAAFWHTLGRFAREVQEEAVAYSRKLGMVAPHTCRTVKPSGSVSKLFGLTEGWHLPSMREYLRWVQFRHDDPLVQQYAAAGYPTRELKSYEGTTIVGFPTAPTITEIMPPELIVTAAEATPEEQYKWVQLGEHYWLRGIEADGTPLADNCSSQISYTLKYDPTKVSYAEFAEMMRRYQPTIKCCSVMPQEDVASYEYQPEQPLTKAEYERVTRGLKQQMTGDIGKEHVDCANGACPVDFNTERK